MNTIALLLILAGGVTSQTAPNGKELKVIQKINATRIKFNKKPLLPNPKLCEFARKEAEIAVTDKIKAQQHKQRLKMSGLVPHGYNFTYVYGKTLSSLSKRLLSSSYKMKVIKDYQNLGVGVFKVPAKPPFYQAVVILAKAQKINPCAGKPGLSQAMVDSTKVKADKKVKKCYDELLAKGNPNSKGSIIYRLTIGKHGTISKMVQTRLDADLKPINSCVTEAVEALHFPKPCGGKAVTIASFGWKLLPPHGSKKIGRISKGQVQGAIQRKKHQIKQCYDKELKSDPKLAGKVVMKFSLRGNGKIKDVAVIKDSLGNQKVKSCLLAISKRLIFPAPKYGGEVEFEYPFEFAPPEEK